jgi:hypothetical protein
VSAGRTILHVATYSAQKETTMPHPNYEIHSTAHERHARRRQDIRVRAFQLWDSAGRPAGMRTEDETWQDFFWRKAEGEVLDREALKAMIDCATSLC